MSALEGLKKEGWHICALEQAHNSVQLQNFKVEAGRKYVIVCGNEVHGVSQEIVDEADTILEIPQFGAKHSLNVSVSTGIAVWHLFSSMQK